MQVLSEISHIECLARCPSDKKAQEILGSILLWNRATQLLQNDKKVHEEIKIESGSENCIWKNVFETISEIESEGWGFLLCLIDIVWRNINLWDSHSVRGYGRGQFSMVFCVSTCLARWITRCPLFLNYLFKDICIVNHYTNYYLISTRFRQRI